MSQPGPPKEQREAEQNRLFQLEGTYNDHLVQVPDQFKADWKFKHAIEKQNRVQGERTWQQHSRPHNQTGLNPAGLNKVLDMRFVQRKTHKVVRFQHTKSVALYRS